MKTPFPILISAPGVLLLAVSLAGAAPKPLPTQTKLALSPQIKRFIAAKEQQVHALAKEHQLTVSPDFDRYFAAASQGDMVTVSNLLKTLGRRSGQYEGSWQDPTVGHLAFQTIIEVQCLLDYLHEAGLKYTESFGREIIKVVTPKAIYFGGTDPGRGVVTGLCKSQIAGDPFYTITQNALADARYLQYVRSTYKTIYVPSDADSQRCFSEYVEDAQKRMQRNELRPGEEVKIIGGRVQVSGQVAVMAINALLTKVIFDQNPDRQFFVEESFPLEWMYPHLSPAGPIMRINRQPLPELTEEMLRRDREYWDHLIAPMVGNWVTDTTTVEEICKFTDWIYANHDRKDFKGDPAFLDSPSAQKAFSKLRSGIGGIYAWRLSLAAGTPPEYRPKTPAQRTRLTREAEFAFKQALVLCPYSPEAVFRYVNLLISLNQPARLDDALLIARICKKLDPANQQVEDLVNKLGEIRRSNLNILDQQANVDSLEIKFRLQPTVSNAFPLAQIYLSLQRTNDAIRALSTALAQPDLDAAALVSLAGAFVQLNQVEQLEKVLKRLTQVSPNNPEAFYDLAGVQALLKRKADALAALKTALALSAERLRKNPEAKDLKSQIEKDGRFNDLRGDAEFQKLLNTP